MDQSYDFPSSYLESRTAFRRSASQNGFQLCGYPIDHVGPQCEELTIDVAISPNTDCRKTLVLSSGLHGVEGFFGAAAQHRFLNRWTPISDVKCVLIHALNPFGFAWRRRFNEDNIDLNRNFLLHDQAYVGSPPGYDNLNLLLNPKCPPSRWELFLPKALLLVARQGLQRLQHAVAAGQYEYPKGIFFGGKQTSKSNQLLRDNLKDWIGQCDHVVHLDFHTGLGRFGSWKLLIDYALSALQASLLTRCIGADAFVAHDANNRSYEAKGELGSWFSEQKLAPNYLYACAEFGTYPPLTVLRALRFENQAHHFGSPDSSSTTAAKQQLVEAFCPNSPQWRRQTSESVDSLIAKMLNGLSEL